MATASARTPGTSAPEVPTDIAELARSLRYDPDLIYQFVRDNIELYPIYGIHKGALGALIDRQGTDADQAELMVYLLRASGYQASAVNGLVVLTKAQIQSFYGVPDNDCAIYNLFGSGRIPVDRFLCSSPSTSLGFLHFWVRVTINGQNYDFDPSFKAHTIKSPINLKSAAGYDQTTFMNNARIGATVTANTVTNLNRTNIRNQLTTYANNLISYIRTNSPAATVDDLIGGKVITPPATRNEPPLRQTVLPYEANYPETVFTDEIPVDYRSILEISTGGQTVDLLADSFYGSRLTISSDANNNLQLLADGELIATFNQLAPGATQDMTVRIFHNAYQDSGVNAGFVKQITGGETLALTLGFGPTTNRLSKVYRDQIAAAVKAGAPENSEPIVGGVLSTLGADVQAQLGMTMNLTDKQVGVNSLIHHFIGAVSEHDGGPLIDLKAIYVSAIQQDYNNVVGTGDFISNTLHGSSFESGVLEQTFGGGAASTIRLLDDAIASGQTIYSGDSSNFETGVKPNLLNCSTSDLSDMSNYASVYRVIVPQNCAGLVEQWKGVGYLVANPNPGNLFVSALIGGGYAGGYLGSRRNLTSADEKNLHPWDRDWWSHPRADPIDMATGKFTYSHDDLSVGSDKFPEGLALQKVYNSGAADLDGPLGRGWTHNLAMRVDRSTDALKGLGEDSPIDAATSIVETMVSLDLLSDQTLPLDKIAATVVGQRWFAEQLKNNIAGVTGPQGQVFTKLPDGSYNSPPENSSKLIANADGSFTQSLVDKSTIEFGADGNVAAWKKPNGLEVHFGYANGQLTSVANSFGRSLTLSYNGDHLASVADGNGRSVSYGYDASGNLTNYTNANGKVTTFEYDQPGRMTKFFLPSHPADPQVVNVYDSLGRIAQQTDADGKAWFALVAGTRSELISPLGYRTADYYDGAGRVISTLEDFDSSSLSKGAWDARERTFTYDGLGRLSVLADTGGPTIQLTYDDASCNSVEKRCTNNVKVRRQVAAHSLSQTATLPDETWSFTYEPQFNNMLTATNQRGKVTDYGYDGAGNLTTVTLPPPADGGTLRPTSTIAYTNFAGAAGFPSLTLPTSLTRNIDATNTIVNRTTYDPANHLVPQTTVVDSGGLNLTSTFGYDAVGNLTSLNGPRTDVSDLTSFSYDSERQQTGNTNALGKVTATNYNDDGDIASTASQLGSQWVATCYARNISGKVRQVVGPATVAAMADCPAAAAPNSVTDLAYDDDGRLLTKTVDLAALEGGSRVSKFEYSPSGRPVALSSAVGTGLEQVTLHNVYHNYAANTALELYSARDPYSKTSLRPSIWVQSNNHGHLEMVRFMGPNGTYCDGLDGGYNCEQYVYDQAGNLVRWTRRDQTAIGYLYDNLNRTTQQIAPTNADSVLYTYDLLGRMLTAKYNVSNGASVVDTYDKAGRMLTSTSGGRTVSYQYDAAGNRTRVTWPDTAFYITYDYDPLNRVSSIKEKGTTLLASFGYDDLSRRTSASYANGTSITYGFDNQARLASQSYDLAGTANDVTRTFARDQAGELTGLTTTNAAYDWNGHYNINRPYTTDWEERYLTSGTKNLTYDQAGNLAGDGTWTFTYDRFGRILTAVVKNSTSLAYSYDPVGRLATRKLGKTSTSFLLDGNQLMGEYSSAGALIRRYVTGGATDDPVLIYDGTNAATKTWLYPDERGSITASANASGAIVSTMSYGPFGEPNVNTGISLRYTGQFLDPDSGLYYYKARWYSPYLGRFMSPDPALLVDGVQTYKYVGNDPVNYSDPSGLAKQLVQDAKDLLPRHCSGTASQHPILTRIALGADVTSGIATVATPFVPEVAIPLQRGANGVSRAIDTYEAGEALYNAANGNNADLINYGFGHAEGAFLTNAGKKFFPTDPLQLRNRKGQYTPDDQTKAADKLGEAGGEILGDVCP